MTTKAEQPTITQSVPQSAIEAATSYLAGQAYLRGNELVKDVPANHPLVLAFANYKPAPSLAAQDGLVEALGEAEWCLKCGVDVPIADPDYHEEVKALGDKIGYGALMSTASKAWREALEAEGIQGGEFVTGPCRSTVENALAKIRAALGPLPAPPTIEEK